MGVRRRGIGGGLLAGLGQGLSHLAESRVKRRQLEDAASIKAADERRTFGQGLLGQILSSKDPRQADQLITLAGQNGMDLSGLTRSPDQRMAPFLSAIQDQTDPLKLPPDPGMAATAYGLTPDVLTQIASALQSKRDQIGARETQTGANLQDVTTFDPTTLTNQRQFVPKGQLPGQTFQTNPTPTQAGTIETQKDQAGKFSPDYVASQTDAANTLESGTRGEKVKTAGAEAGARLAVENSPEAIQARVDQAVQQANALEASKPASDTERGAASFYVRSIRGHNAALDLEGKGVNFAGANNLPPLVRSSLMKQYNQAQHEFILAALRKETGAAISPQELTDFAVTYFGQANDPPEVVLQKQQARIALINGLKPQAGRAIREYQQQGIGLPTITEPPKKGSTLDGLMKPPGTP